MALWQILGWIIAALLGLPAAVHYTLRLKSRWEEGKQRRLSANAAIRTVVRDAINMAKNYDSMGEGQFQELIDDARVSKKLRRKLYELKRLAEQYQIWRDESWEIVYNNVVVERMIFKDVDESLKQVSESLSGVFNKEQTPDIYKAIYQENLTPEMARELLLGYRRDSTVKLKDKATGEEKKLQFRDVVEGEEFNSFIKRLMQLQYRESIKMLREVQARFVDRAEGVMREV